MAILADLDFDALLEEDAKRSSELVVSLASWGSATSPRYAAIWRDDGTEPRPRQIWRFLQEEPFVATGPLVSPVLLTMTGSISRFGGPPGVATTVVYEEYASNADLPSVAFVASESLGDLLDAENVSATSEPLAVDAVWYRKVEGGKPQHRVAGLFLANSSTAVWGAYMTPVEVLDSQLRFDASVAAAAKSFKRVHFAIPSPSTAGGKRQALVVMQGNAYEPWREDLDAPSSTFGLQEGGSLVDGPFPVSAFAADRNLREAEGYTAIAVGANGWKSGARLCITWAARATPLTPFNRRIDGPDAGPARVAPTQALPPQHSQLNYDSATTASLVMLRNWVRNQMTNLNISNAQVAIAYRGRLKVLWSLTRGETGWPLTQPTSRFRIASSIKLVTAMMAVTLGESFLQRTLPEALGISFAEAVPNGPTDADGVQRWLWFAQTTIEDCLHHVSCLTIKGGWSEVFDKGRRQLPLKPGDLSLALRQGGLKKLVVRAPRTYEGYNNWGYVAVGEAISRELKNGQANRFLDALQDWVIPSVAQRISYIPKTREACLDQGEIPVRSRGCTRRNTMVDHDTVKAAGVALPPYAPGGYDVDDYDLWGPTGGVNMSLPTFMRMMQMLHPEEAPSDLTGTRLRVDQVFRMLQRFPAPLPNEFSAGVPEATTFGLGAVVGPGRQGIYFDFGRPNPTAGAEWELTWGGNLPSGQSGFAHFVFPRPDGTDFLSNPDSLSVAWITNNGQRLGQWVGNFWLGNLRTQAIAIQQQGGWDNAVDLFPALGLL